MMNFESKKGAWHDQTMKKKSKKNLLPPKQHFREVKTKKPKPKNDFDTSDTTKK